MEDCRIHAGSLQHLPQLTALTSLKLHALGMLQQRSMPREVNVGAEQYLGGTLSSMIQTSKQLQELSLDLVDDVQACLTDAVSGLQHLQSFSCVLPHSAEQVSASSHELLLQLPASLTALQLSAVVERDDCDSTKRPALRSAGLSLSHLTGLKQLQLSHLQSPAALVSGLTHLQRLVLDHVTLHAWTAAEAAEDPWRRPPTAPVFLEFLQQLTELEHLKVLGCNLFGIWEEVDPSRLTALTASSHLTALQVQAYNPLPDNFLQHTLARDRQLQHIRSLQVAAPESSWTLLTLRLPSGRFECIKGADVAAVAACCPNLQQADFSRTLAGAAAGRGLTELTALTDLSLEGEACCTALAQEVAQLTGLSKLQWGCCWATERIAELQSLTALTELQELQLWGGRLWGSFRRHRVDALTLKTTKQVRATHQCTRRAICNRCTCMYSPLSLPCSPLQHIPQTTNHAWQVMYSCG
jgi:hypothetical protein